MHALHSSSSWDKNWKSLKIFNGYLLSLHYLGINKVVGSPIVNQHWYPLILNGTSNSQGQVLGYYSQWCKGPSNWRKCSNPTSWWWILSCYANAMTSFWFLFFFLFIIRKYLYIVCLPRCTYMSGCPWFLACEAKLPSLQISLKIITKR